MELLPLDDGHVRRSSFHGRHRFGTLRGQIGTFESRSFAVVVVQCAD